MQNATNFDNEKIAKNNELFNAMMTNASNTYNLNTLYPYYNINPQAYGDVEFTENGQQLYKTNQVDQQEAFLDAYTKLRKNLPADQKIDAAFLEFAKPDIKDLVEVFISKNINDVYFYPYFLNSGKHVTIDLPNIINSLKLKYSNINFKLLPHFGLSSNITDIIINDLSSNF